MSVRPGLYCFSLSRIISALPSERNPLGLECRYSVAVMQCKCSYARPVVEGISALHTLQQQMLSQLFVQTPSQKCPRYPVFAVLFDALHLTLHHSSLGLVEDRSEVALQPLLRRRRRVVGSVRSMIHVIRFVIGRRFTSQCLVRSYNLRVDRLQLATADALVRPVGRSVVPGTC